jgi:hypothetical protein
MPARSVLFPKVGLLYACLLTLLAFPGILIFNYAWGHGRSPFGLDVVVYSRGSRRILQHSCPRTWLLRVEAEQIWYLNSERVKPEDLPSLLRKQIGDHKTCFVLLDASPDLPCYVPVHAIDLIQEVPATAILLTPETKRTHIP